MKFKPTDEQEEINASESGIIIANAFAGTGKTSTLELYTHTRPTRKFLYLAYNKSLQLDAERRFGSNVVCKTTHSLAYHKFGAPYRHKLGNLRPLLIAQRFNTDFTTARWVYETLDNYISSHAQTIEEKHLSSEVQTGITADRVLTLTRDAWAAMVDKNDSLLMTHDGYLKLYALSKPDLSDRFDSILFDECQDANPVTSLIVLRQSKHAQIIMVGDRHQAIYGFRGSRNAMDLNIEADRHYLTKSFRFGPGIAAVASEILSSFCGEPRPLQGLGPHDAKFRIDRNKPYTYLARTNAGIFEGAIEAVQSRTPFCLMGGYDRYNFSTIVDTWNLAKGRKEEVKDQFISRFNSYAEAVDYAETCNDVPLKALIKAVDKYKDSIPGLCAKIKEKAIPDTVEARERAHILFSSAHRSKGLEFDQVRMGNDFVPLVESDDEDNVRPVEVNDRKTQEEMNLLYVAMTRAKHSIELNDATNEYLFRFAPHLAETLGHRVGLDLGPAPKRSMALP